MVLGLGVDITEICRMEQALARTPGIVDRLFTPLERTQCLNKGNQAASFAARFAGKEAVFKALGGGVGLGWKNVELIQDKNGAPRVNLHGTASIRAAELGVQRVLVSLTHSKEYACASAIALGGIDS